MAKEPANARLRSLFEKRKKLEGELREAGFSSARYVAPDFLFTATDAEAILAVVAAARELRLMEGE